MTHLTTDRIDYSAAALFTPLKNRAAGGSAISGAFESAGAFRPKLPAALQDLHFGDKDLRIAGLDKFVSPVVVATTGGGTAWGLKWTGAGTPGVFPEYFRVSDTAMTSLAADEGRPRPTWRPLGSRPIRRPRAAIWRPPAAAAAGLARRRRRAPSRPRSATAVWSRIKGAASSTSHRCKASSGARRKRPD